jgi:hypothetical protein
MEFTAQQVLDILRDTPIPNYAVPCSPAEFLEECRALGAVQVRKEVFAEMLLHHAPQNNTSPMCMLQVLEDYNHAFIGDGTYWIVMNYLQPKP